MEKVESKLISDSRLANAMQAAKAELEHLQANKGGDVPKLILWSLSRDAALICMYEKTGERSYAIAAFQNVRNVTNIASDSPGDVKVTVETLPQNGYEVCYTSAAWADLKNPSYLTFANPSASTENLPKNLNYVFWSRDFQ